MNRLEKESYFGHMMGKMAALWPSSDSLDDRHLIGGLYGALIGGLGTIGYDLRKGTKKDRVLRAIAGSGLGMATGAGVGEVIRRMSSDPMPNKIASLRSLLFKMAEQGVGTGRRTLTPAERQDADDIINGFNDLKKPVDPKALMAGRPVRVGAGESTFSPNPLPARRPQLSDKDISGMQSAFGGKQPQKPLPKRPMLPSPVNNLQ